MNDLIIFKTKANVLWMTTTALLKQNKAFKLRKGQKRWVESEHHGGIFVFLNDPNYRTPFDELAVHEQQLIMEFLLK